jgi:hypothetical protein
LSEGSGDAEAGLPDWVTEKLTEAFHRIQNQLGGRKLWHERFTDTDRSKFAEPWPQVWDSNQGTIGMWCKARGTSWNRAIAEVAHALGFLDGPTRDALLALLPAEDANDTAEQPKPNATSVLPVWKKATGELLYLGNGIREVKPTAANLRLILNSFHEATDRRRRAVATLNQGLTGIRFLCEGNGKKIRWEAVGGEPADEKAKQS